MIHIREKDRIRNDIITRMLGDLERLHKKGEITDETYEELKAKYEKKMGEVDEYYGFAGLGDVIREKVEKSIQKAFKSTKIHFGETFTREETIKGTFDSEDIDIDFKVENGKIELKKSDTDEYNVLIRKRVKASDSEEAEKEFESIDLTVEQESNRLAIYATDMVDIIAEIPEKRYRVRAESENGSVMLSDLNGETSTLKTENGKIIVKNAKFADLTGTTENGRIEVQHVGSTTVKIAAENGSLLLEEINTENLTAETENGRISSTRSKAKTQRLMTERGAVTADISSGENYIRTKMGSVKIKVPGETKASIEVRTSMGSIRSEGKIIESKDGYKKIILNEDGIKEAKIKVQTDFGSIKIVRS
ncbi:MAG: DUF4097 family beta strand repeat-containing protein [Euryarchaeota archaeon]|nr:DUF4097 family beta strand repeat-containing protein [Euryarchaeota archaeon]